MTEEEDKKKRCSGPCPENTGISNAGAVTQAAPDGIYVPLFYHCSGSECMAWGTYPVILSNPEDMSYESSGYCGFSK